MRIARPSSGSMPYTMVMRRHFWIWGLIGLGALAATLGFWVGSDESVARADTGVTKADKPSVIDAPPVLMLSGVPGQTRTDVVVASPGSTDLPSVLASVEHVPEAVVRGAVLPGGSSVVVVADTIPARELSWAASLLMVEPAKAPRSLTDRVYHASRPLVTPDGRVFVQRGSAGAIVSNTGQSAPLRVDDLTIDEVDPSSGSTRSILHWKGYETHLAGALDHELIVYRVGPQGADLVAVHMDTAKVRVVVPSWPPMARDFSVDETQRAVVVQQLDPGPPRRWVVEQVSLASGVRRLLASSPHRDMVPYAWPDGGVLVNPADRRGPRVVSSSISGIQLGGLAGSGVLWLRATSTDRAWITGSWAVPGSLPVGVVVRASDGRVLTVPSQEGHRVDVLGVVGGAS